MKGKFILSSYGIIVRVYLFLPLFSLALLIPCSFTYPSLTLCLCSLNVSLNCMWIVVVASLNCPALFITWLMLILVNTISYTSWIARLLRNFTIEVSPYIKKMIDWIWNIAVLSRIKHLGRAFVLQFYCRQFPMTCPMVLPNMIQLLYLFSVLLLPLAIISFLSCGLFTDDDSSSSRNV